MIRQRTYSGEVDKSEMIQLSKLSRLGNLHVTDLPYRLSSWALDEPDNVSLWVDEDGQLVAWAVMQTPFWTIDYALKPDIEDRLHKKILSWADRRARMILKSPSGIPSWFVSVFPEQAVRREELEQHGFVSQAQASANAWSQVLMARSGSMEVPFYPLPKGFTLRPLAGESEAEAYVQLHRAVFGTDNMTTEWRRRTILHADYHPDLDIVAVSPDGRLAAFCIGWLDQSPGGAYLGQIEPLGCHKDFRNYALGRIVLCEVLRCLQQRGAQSIIVETDNYRDTAYRLYENVGFKVVREVLVYGKDYNDGSG